MKILEINMDGFGKFHKYHERMDDGIQVFYGKNEAGKTTIKKFMISMLFGLEKARGLAARNDDLTRYQPINGGTYGGSMTFEKDGVSYRMLRNFAQGSQKYRLFYADTMEEIRQIEKLFECDRQAFENTVSMTQADIRTGKEMKEVLQNSMANLRSSKDATIDLRKANDYLKAKRRQKRKDPVFTKVEIFRDRQNQARYDQRLLEEYEQEESQIRKKLQQKRKLTLLQRIFLWIFRFFGAADEEKIEKMELKHRLEIIQVEKAQLKQQKEQSEELRNQYQHLLTQKRSIEKEIYQIELAIKAINEAASQVQKTFGQELNEKISEIFAYLTGGKYQKVIMDDDLVMMVYDGFNYIDMKYLSNATVEQLYFALRIASADLLYEKDEFPLFLDDVFGNYDDERLKATLLYLAEKTDRQIFLFTGRKEILRLLDENEILYHLISL